MVDLNNIKTVLKLAGISYLKIDFDDESDIVNLDYVFKGVPGTKRITYKEIVDDITIGIPEIIENITDGRSGPSAGCILDVEQELK